MADDSFRRTFFRARPAKNTSRPTPPGARPWAPALFPLLRYAVEYGLTTLIVALFIAFLMNRLAGMLLRLIIVRSQLGLQAP